MKNWKWYEKKLLDGRIAGIWSWFPINIFQEGEKLIIEPKDPKDVVYVKNKDFGSDMYLIVGDK